MTEEMLIPVILTTSAKQILRHFNESIVGLEAWGSSMASNKIVLDEKYGILMNNPGATEMQIRYERKVDSHGDVINPLTKDTVADICEEIDSRLPPYEDRNEGKVYDPDLTVDTLVINVDDEELQEKANAGTSNFDLVFKSEPVYNESRRDDTRKANEDIPLYKFHGFKIRTLNLHVMMEVAERYGETRNPVTVIEWNGLRDTQPKAPKRVAQRIEEKYLPDKCKELNFIKVRDNRFVELIPVR